MVKATLKNEIALFVPANGLKFTEKKPIHCYIWNVAFYGAES